MSSKHAALYDIKFRQEGHVSQIRMSDRGAGLRFLLDAFTLHHYKHQILSITRVEYSILDHVRHKYEVYTSEKETV